MNLIFDDVIRKKYLDPVPGKFKRSLESITEIVIHGTGGGDSALGIINWMIGGERAEQYKQGIGLFHYEIDYNGDIYNLLQPDIWCYHSSCGLHDRLTIGIELLNKKEQNAGPYTDEQYIALFELIDFIKRQSPIKIITGHGANYQKYSGGGKKCPGNMFDWQRLELRYDLELIDNERYMFPEAA